MNELITGLNGGNVPALDIIMLLTFAALLPSIVVMMSSFMRIIIILSFTRNAMGVQQTPPNMVLTGMALFFVAVYYESGYRSDQYGCLRAL